MSPIHSSLGLEPVTFLSHGWSGSEMTDHPVTFHVRVSSGEICTDCSARAFLALTRLYRPHPGTSRNELSMAKGSRPSEPPCRPAGGTRSARHRQPQ